MADINLHEIVKSITDVALGRQEKLFVPDLSVIFASAQANELLDELWRLLSNERQDDALIDADLSLRELIKVMFTAMGIEIEFSGRDKYEKAVVIDFDADLAARLNLNANALMPGQTVVRVISA